MNFLGVVLAFLLGGVTVIALEVFAVNSFLDGVREFLRMGATQIADTIRSAGF